jgi:phosphoribosylformylglycinamidine (FGAM) synthase PurS component
MEITVYNNSIEVFSGTLSEFLLDNDNDQYLSDICKQLKTNNIIEFVELSGTWRIERAN